MSAPLAVNKARKPRGQRIAGHDDQNVLEFEETMMLCTVPSTSAPAQSVTFYPGSSGAIRLDEYGRLYTQYRIEYLELIYRSQVPATTNGFAVISVDYNSGDIPSNYTQTAAITPRMCGKVWTDMSIVLPCNRLMKSQWHYTSVVDSPGFRSACDINFHSTGVNGTLVGSLWIKYRIRFCGPTAATITPPATSYSTGSGILNTGLPLGDSGVDAGNTGTPSVGSTVGGASGLATTAGSGYTKLTYNPGNPSSTPPLPAKVVLSTNPNVAKTFSATDIVENIYNITLDVPGTQDETPPTVTYIPYNTGDPYYNPTGAQPLLEFIVGASQYVSTTTKRLFYTVRVCDYAANLLAGSVNMVFASAITIAAGIGALGYSTSWRRQPFLPRLPNTLAAAAVPLAAQRRIVKRSADDEQPSASSISWFTSRTGKP